jgi:hypothetical protein
MKIETCCMTLPPPRLSSRLRSASDAVTLRRERISLQTADRENFFRPQDQKLKAIPFAKVERVVSDVRKAAPGAEVFLQAPQTLFHLRQGVRGVEMVGAQD